MRTPRREAIGPGASWSWLVVASLALALSPGRSAGQEGAGGVLDLSPFRACGLNCLFVVAKMSGCDVSLKALGGELKPREDGESSIDDLERASKAIGLDPISARVGMDALGTIPLPAIVHLKTRARQSDSSHYVVLVGLHRRGVILIDAPTGATVHPYAEFAAEWTGVAVAFANDADRRDRFLSELRRRDAWAVWPIRIVVAGSLGCLAWFLFAKSPRRSRPGRRPTHAVGMP